MKPLSVCIIGNSHLAAIKLGHAAVAADFPEIQLDFYGGVAQRLWALEQEGTTLVPRHKRLAENFAETSGGRRRIETADYDAFVLVGLFFGLVTIGPLFAVGRPYSGEAGVDLVSRPFLRAGALDLLGRSLAAVTADKVLRARAAACPILLIPTPFPSEAVRGTQDSFWASDDAVARLRECYDEAVSTLSRQAAFEVLAQPAQTIAPPACTRAAYSMDSVAFGSDAAHPEDDHVHMNADYGAVVLAAALRRLTELTGSGEAQPARI